MMGKKDQYTFDIVPHNDVPSATPVSGRPINPSGSRWDDAIEALRDSPGMAIRVTAQDGKNARHLEQTLKTRATNLQIPIQTRADGDCFYAWVVEEFGRFPPPKPID